jgi:TolB-like protein
MWEGGIDVAEGNGEEQTSSARPGTPDVFISYASQDSALADAVVSALERQGLKCWIAPRDVTPGEFYADAIVRAINEAMILVLVLTENAVTSPHVLREVERTSAKRHSIVSFRIGAVKLPPALEYFLSASHWLDASTSSVESAMPKLVEAVKRLVAPSSGVDSNRANDTMTSAADLFPRPPSANASQRVSRPVLALSAVIALGLAYLAVNKLWLEKHTAGTQPVAAMAPAPAPAAQVISEKSVAVLPFIDMSEKKDQEYFSDGLSEELIDMLTKIPDLRVPARTSSFYFKGKQATIADIAKALGVAHVLEGSVRKSGNTLRITAQLIRVDSGYHIWSETYDRQFDDIFKIQAALPLYLKAIELDPVNIRNYQRLADAYDNLGRFADAEASLRKALELEPTFPGLHGQLGFEMARLGRQNEALAEIQKEMDEQFRWISLAAAYTALGRKADADAALAVVEQRYATSSPLAIAELHAVRGNVDQSFNWLNRACLDNPECAIFIKPDSAFNSIRGDPRYKALLRKMNLPE